MDIELSFLKVVILICSGFIVGIVNTFAGGGTILSSAILMSMGMPILTALGTNRICIFLQNIVSSFTFKKNNLLNIKHALKLFIPLGIGAVLGSILLQLLSDYIVTILFTFGSLFSLVMVFVRSSVIERANDGKDKSLSIKEWLFLFFIGIYGGSIYVGIGYMILALYIMSMGYDLIRANALKGLMAMLLVPVSILPFILTGNINFEIGLIHSIGNILGAYVASRNAQRIGIKKIRWFMIVMIVVSVTNTLIEQNIFEKIRKFID